MKKTKRRKVSLLFLLPSATGVMVFIFLPFLDVIRRTFVTPLGGQFTGALNYKAVLGNDAFKLASANTGRFIIIALPLLLILSLFIGVIIHSILERAGVFKTIFLVPMVVPVASVVLFWQVVFSSSGILNNILSQLGESTVDWMNSPKAFWVLVGSFLWKNLGYSTILWIAGLSDIPENLYEVAQIDGAGRIRTFFSVVLPGLRPCLYTVSVLSLVNIFKVFREAWLVAGDYPHTSIYLLQHLFNNWFRELSIDKLAVASVLFTGAIIIITTLLRKGLDDEG